MKKRTIFWILTLLAVICLNSCGNTLNGGKKSESQSDTIPDYSSMKLLGSETISVNDLKLMAFIAEPEDMMAVNAKVEKNNMLTIDVYKTGQTNIRVSDCFGHTASVTVKVSDSNKITLTLNPCEKSFIEVSNFGAVGDGKTDDTVAFQKAIDSAKPGETVYVYPGVYRLSYLQMRAGITLQMASPMKDASEGYSDALLNRVKNREAAVLKGVKLMNGIKQAHGQAGVGDFTVSGGILDMTGTSSEAFVCSGAENIRLENIIFKDTKRNPALRLINCRNVAVINCMFAGYVSDASYVQEVVLIEASPDDGAGVVLERCYFGASNSKKAPPIAVGYRYLSGVTSGARLQISDCVFDGCTQSVISYPGAEIGFSGNMVFQTEK